MLAALSCVDCVAEAPPVETLSQSFANEATDAETASASSFVRRSPFQQSTTLGELDGSVSVDGALSFFNRIDRFQFEVSDSGQLEIEVDFERVNYAGLILFDQSGSVVTRASLQRATTTSIDADLEAGSYTAILLGGRGNYSMTFDFEADVPVVEEPTVPDPVTEEPTIEEPIAEEPVEESTPQTELPSVDYYGGNFDWNLNAINAPEAWEAGYLGDGVVVAVIDTGVDIGHSDLDDNVWVNADEIAGDGIDNDGNGYIDDLYGWNFVAGNNNVSDDNGHGTHVAGTIAAEQNGFGATGVAPDAQILPIKVLSSNGSGFSSSIANGIRYAVDNGANIINLSLGGGFSNVIASALSYAASNDVLVVAASGNESSSVPSSPASLSRNYDNVLSVGAYSSNGQIAGFSNGVGNSGAVQVDAPGVSIYSTAANGGYRFLSGTSMATPHVAGLAALTLSANSNLSAESLRNIIVQTADRSASGSDANGIVNASLAIPAAINASTSGGCGVQHDRCADDDQFEFSCGGIINRQ